ncbi:crossover junction endodeoxyribonuclease RuvC [Intrasporangium sp.]|uniref:crossover junction endodeoxyribonuclease RuvC n=1 Tax=Intrasporangium sp. TaxID=1925024 RepID=UPI00293B49EA|nr:crossover junction endodeoxyribonuclease RuvC [Intrasporangium sp.]MDV3223441.1 crossover junction endodeoxyribonuclease RuvC [Intrasporangium sp.]
MRVLAVDPGLTRCGVGVVDGRPGRQLSLVGVGVIRTPSTDPTPKRLVALEDELRAWFERHQPEAVAIERVFADTNVSTVMGTAQCTGIVMMLAERRGLPVTLHTPTEVKAAVSGSGRADKRQVTTMVTRLLGLESSPRPADAADALALAICHVWRGGTQSRFAEAAEAHAAVALTRRATAARPRQTPTAGAPRR